MIFIFCPESLVCIYESLSVILTDSIFVSACDNKTEVNSKKNSNSLFMIIPWCVDIYKIVA